MTYSFRIPLTIVVAACMLCPAGCDGNKTEPKPATGTSRSSAATASAGAAPARTATGAAASDKPNIIWIVWDTVRRDHMGEYGYERATTPNVDTWAAGARVYTNCLSAANTTAPSHASMFTGLLPSEHGASNENSVLGAQFDTIAELLRDKSGYDTYMFAANPHLTASGGFAQGFDVEEHPWSPQYAAEAARIIKKKLDPRDHSSEMGRKMRSGNKSEWTLKTAGALAQVGVEKWLDGRKDHKPFFIFLNYMEAHRPLIPAERFRNQMMTPEEVKRSFEVDRSWGKTWAYTMGVGDYTDDEIDLTRKTYDACLLELDDMFAQLMASLDKRGALDNTIVILTADHGEQLGEHHMLDHQYSLYNVLLQVPLIIHYPPAFEPGRDDRPVMNFDLFPTLLRLAGVARPARSTQALDLRDVPQERARLSEYPLATDKPVKDVAAAYPGFDTAPWLRSIRAVTAGHSKFLCFSDGSRELYDLAADPAEMHNLLLDNPSLAYEPCAKLAAYLKRLTPPGQPVAAAQRTPEELQRLEALGYNGGGEKEREASAGDAIEDYCNCGAESGADD